MSEKLLEAFKMVIHNDKSTIRRYIILGSFDGLLVALSIIISSAVARTPSIKIIPLTLSGIIGVSISSMWNTIVAEYKEKEEELRRLERQMMKSLRGTVYEYSMRIGILLATLSHTVSPFVGIVPLLIYLILKSVTLTILLSAVSLSLLGIIYEGELREKLLTMTLMVSAGIISALLSILITTTL